MSEFFSLLKFVVGCSSLLFLVFLVLLAMPQSKLRYIGLELTKYAITAGLVLLTISPLDCLPGLPIDDFFYVIGAIVSGRSALQDRKKRQLIEQIELAQLIDRTEGDDDVQP